MSGQRRLYFRDTPNAVVERDLDGLTLLFHRPSGLTHIVDSPLPEILAALTATPVDASALLQRLSARFDLEADTDAVAEIGQHLDSLIALGLVRVRQ